MRSTRLRFEHPTLLLLVLSSLAGGATPGLASGDPAQGVPIFVSGIDRSYTRLDADSPTTTTVRGPGELRVVSRARFAPHDDVLRYGLHIRIDGGAPQTVIYEQVERSRRALFRDGTLGVPGRLMSHRIELTRGYHNIEITPGTDGPEVFHRVLFEPRRARQRRWVAITPRSSAHAVDLVVREELVTYFRNPAGGAFDLEVIGPTELRIFTRTENAPTMRGRIHYRLQVRTDGAITNTFQLSSRRSHVATYHTDDSLLPGRAVEIVIPIAAGRHQISIHPLDPDKSTFLARFFLPREDLALTAD